MQISQLANVLQSDIVIRVLSRARLPTSFQLSPFRSSSNDRDDSRTQLDVLQRTLGTIAETIRKRRIRRRWR